MTLSLTACRGNMACVDVSLKWFQAKHISIFFLYSHYSAPPGFLSPAWTVAVIRTNQYSQFRTCDQTPWCGLICLREGYKESMRKYQAQLLTLKNWIDRFRYCLGGMLSRFHVRELLHIFWNVMKLIPLLNVEFILYNYQTISAQEHLQIKESSWILLIPLMIVSQATPIIMYPPLLFTWRVMCVEISSKAPPLWSADRIV